MKIRSTFLLLALLAATLAGDVIAGGWSVLTLDHLVDRVTVSEPVSIGFTIRGHGRTLADGLDTRTIFEHEESGRKIQAAAVNDENGHYTVVVTFPIPGVWQWRIDGYGIHFMPDINVIASESGETASAVDNDKAAALFIAKGCIACHMNRNVATAAHTVPIGPDLTSYRGNPDFLRTWLANPDGIRPGTYMPSLGLNDSEIETLVAFLTGGMRIAETE